MTTYRRYLITGSGGITQLGRQILPGAEIVLSDEEAAQLNLSQPGMIGPALGVSTYIPGAYRAPEIDPATGGLLDPTTQRRLTTTLLTRIVSNPSTTRQSVLMPKTATRARLTYKQGTGSAAVGEVLYLFIGAAGDSTADIILADQTLRDVLLLGKTIEFTLPGDQALRVDFKSKAAETGSSQLVIEVDAVPVDISGTYITCCPCLQTRADTIVRDASGRNNNLTFGANLTEAIAWATAGQLTTPATSNNSSAALANATMDAEFMMSRGDILLIHLDHDVTITSGTQGWLGNSSAFSATNSGFRLRGELATTYCSLGLHSTTQDKYLTMGSVCDGERHTTTLILDTAHKKAYVAHDGFIYAAEWDWSDMTGTLDNTGTNAFRFGSANTTATQACIFYGIHMARLDSVPDDLDALASWLTFAPSAPLDL